MSGLRKTWQPEGRRIHRSASDADPPCVEGTRACDRRIDSVPSLLEPARIRLRAPQRVWGPRKRQMRRLDELEGHIRGLDEDACGGRRTARGMPHASRDHACGHSGLCFHSCSVVWGGYRAAQRFARAGRARPRAGLAVWLWRVRSGRGCCLVLSQCHTRFAGRATALSR